MRRNFNHRTVLKYVVSTVYIASGIIMFAIFLSNATGWRGENARTIKAELKAMFNVK